jgi:hypothetical protein
MYKLEYFLNRNFIFVKQFSVLQVFCHADVLTHEDWLVDIKTMTHVYLFVSGTYRLPTTPEPEGRVWALAWLFHLFGKAPKNQARPNSILGSCRLLRLELQCL